MNASEQKVIGKQGYRAYHYCRAIDTGKATLQEIVDKFNGIGYDRLSNHAELMSLLFNTDTFLYNRATGGGLKIEGANGASIKVNHTIAQSMVDYKPGCKELKELIKSKLDAEKLYSSPISTGLGVESIKQLYTLSDEGAVVLTDYAQERKSKAGLIYVQTPKGKRLASFLTNIAKELQDPELQKYLGIQSHLVKHDDSLNLQGVRFLAAMGEIMEGFDLTNGSPIVRTDDTAFPRARFDY